MRAQNAGAETAAEARAAQFAAPVDAQQMRLEIRAPSGELVFEAEAAAGQTIQWDMNDQKGARVADGVYLATVTVVDSGGKRRKRVEQVNVSAAPGQEMAAAAAASGRPPWRPPPSRARGRRASWPSSTASTSSATA